MQTEKGAHGHETSGFGITNMKRSRRWLLRRWLADVIVRLKRRSVLKLPWRTLALEFRSSDAGRWTEIELVEPRRRLVLGGDAGDRIKTNFLSGLDENVEHDPRMGHPGLGPHAFYFQGMASTSSISAVYQPDGTLRLLVDGARGDNALLVTFDLTPADRALWTERVNAWQPVAPWRRSESVVAED